MIRIRLIVFVFLVGWAALHLPAMSAPQATGSAPAAVQEETTKTERRRNDARPDGFWPTPRLTRLMLSRLANRVAEAYGLDAAQREEFRRMTVERWSAFLEANRRDLEPLLTEFLEMRLEPAPPSQEQVREWACRAQAALGRMEQELEGSTEDLRKTLPPDRRTKIDQTGEPFASRMELLREQLSLMESGKFDVRRLWLPPKSKESKITDQAAERSPDEAIPVARTPSLRPEDDQIAREVQAWRTFVEDFADRNALDEAQRGAARSILAELSRRALAHRDAHVVAIARLEQLIRNHEGTPQELAEIETQIMRLYGPVDAMFQELDRRLRGILDSRQQKRER